jgi:protein-S-isoprenylcysteine O-methyltransferase Ste14
VEFIPVLAMVAVGMVGICLMLTAFIMIGFRGGWQQAMKPDERGPWPPPRRLMLVGASLGVVFPLLLFIPGAIPWWDYSSPYRTWGLGVVFGIVVGGGLTNVYWGVRLMRQNRRGEVDRIPHSE